MLRTASSDEEDVARLPNLVFSIVDVRLEVTWKCIRKSAEKEQGACYELHHNEPSNTSIRLKP